MGDYVIPRPGNSGLIQINQTQHYSVEVSFYSPPIYADWQKNIGDLRYTVYYYMYACKNASEIELCHRAHILWTPCGLRRSNPTETKTLAYSSVGKSNGADLGIDHVYSVKHTVSFHDL